MAAAGVVPVVVVEVVLQGVVEVVEAALGRHRFSASSPAVLHRVLPPFCAARVFLVCDPAVYPRGHRCLFQSPS